MEKKLDHVKINMIVVVRMAIVEQVKNFVILLMDVNLNMVYVDVVMMRMIYVQMVTVVVQKDTVVPQMHSVPLIMDVKLSLVNVQTMDIHVQKLNKN